MNTKQVTCKFFQKHLPRQSPVIKTIRKIPVRATTFVYVTDIVPERWSPNFWGAISSNAPFTWGDCSHSMVTAETFANHCKEFEADDIGTTSGAYREWLKKVYRLGQTYIDLEN